MDEYAKVFQFLLVYTKIPKIGFKGSEVTSRNLIVRVNVSLHTRRIGIKNGAEFKPEETFITKSLNIYSLLLSLTDIGNQRLSLEDVGSLSFSEGLAVWVEENVPLLGFFSDDGIRRKVFMQRFRIMAFRYVIPHKLYEKVTYRLNFSYFLYYIKEKKMRLVQRKGSDERCKSQI
jgi:hypothetical protein